MSRPQRMVLAAVGAVIALLAVAVGVTALARENDEARVAVRGNVIERGDGHEESAPTSTTYALVPVTSGEALPTTTVPPPPKPPPPPEGFAAPAVTAAGSPTNTTSKPAGPPPFGSATHVLNPPPDGTPTRAVDKAKGCYSAVDAGWKVVECGALKRDDAVLLWVVESRNSAKRVLVLRERTAGQWALVLAAEDGGRAWSSVGVRAGDVSGDGRPDLVFGVHRVTTRNVELEVVDGPGMVTLSTTLAGPATSVRLEPGALHAWQSTADGGARHDTIRRIAGAWQIAASESLPRSSVPPSMV